MHTNVVDKVIKVYVPRSRSYATTSSASVVASLPCLLVNPAFVS